MTEEAVVDSRGTMENSLFGLPENRLYRFENSTMLVQTLNITGPQPYTVDVM